MSEEQKKRFVTPAKIAFVFAMLAALYFYALVKDIIRPISQTFGILAVFSGIAIILGLVGLLCKFKQRSVADIIFAVFAIVMALVMFNLIFLPQLHIDYEQPPRVVCGTNLRGLGAAMQIYSQDYKEKKYPSSDKWCDLMHQYLDVSLKTFQCPYASFGPCNYAMNPNCEPNSPADTVLLFETKGGWNQYGGAELLTAENHDGKGCNVSFNNGSAKFVKKKDFGELKWK